MCPQPVGEGHKRFLLLDDDAPAALLRRTALLLRAIRTAVQPAPDIGVAGARVVGDEVTYFTEF